MKIKTAVFETSAASLPTCPRWALPEFAFIGRSNVGKSSLINLLGERRDLAKVSVVPGKTRLINFFRFNSSWSLVDLPGYGFAKGNKMERADFNEAVANYLEKRDNLQQVFVLIDSRLSPQKIDLDFIRWLQGVGTPYSLIFTKTDKQSNSVTQSNVTIFKKTLGEFFAEMPPSFLSSSTTKTGRTEILGYIEQILAKPRPTQA